MDEWDEIDLLGAPHITFSRKGGGELAFIAIEADLDVRYGSRDGATHTEFSWEGFDDGSPASGRGWAALGPPGVSSATSSSTRGTLRASSPSAKDLLQQSARPLFSIFIASQTGQRNSVGGAQRLLSDTTRGETWHTAERASCRTRQA
jgi:hypothetical protein